MFVDGYVISRGIYHIILRTFLMSSGAGLTDVIMILLITTRVLWSGPYQLMTKSAQLERLCTMTLTSVWKACSRMKPRNATTGSMIHHCLLPPLSQKLVIFVVLVVYSVITLVTVFS